MAVLPLENLSGDRFASDRVRELLVTEMQALGIFEVVDVGEVNRVLRYDQIESRLKNPPKPVVVYDKFPSDRRHGWKYIRFGPDG